MQIIVCCNEFIQLFIYSSMCHHLITWFLLVPPILVLLLWLSCQAADICHVGSLHFDIEIGAHCHELLCWFHALCWIEILIAFSHALILTSFHGYVFVTLSHVLPTSAVFVEEIVIWVLSWRETLIHHACWLTIHLATAGSITHFADINTLVNLLILALLWCYSSPLARRWDSLFITLSRAFDSALRRRWLWRTITNRWYLLGIHHHLTLVSWFGTWGALLHWIIHVAAHLFLEVLHALLSSNVSSILTAALASDWCPNPILIRMSFFIALIDRWYLAALIVSIFILSWSWLWTDLVSIWGRWKSLFAVQTLEIMSIIKIVGSSHSCRIDGVIIICLIILTTNIERLCLGKLLFVVFDHFRQSCLSFFPSLNFIELIFHVLLDNRQSSSSLSHHFFIVFDTIVIWIFLSIVIADLFVVFKSDHDCCNIIQGFGIYTVMEHFVDNQSCLLMQRYSWIVVSILYNVLIDVFANYWIFLIIAFSSLPCLFHNIKVISLFKDTITAQDNEIVIFLNLKALDIRFWNYTSWVASVADIFRFDVADCSWNRKSTWEDTMRSYNSLNSTCIIWWWIRHVTFILIDLASICFNSFGLNLILRFVI